MFVLSNLLVINSLWRQPQLIKQTVITSLLMAVVLGFMGYKIGSNDCLTETEQGNRTSEISNDLTSVQDRMGIMLFLTVMVKYLSLMNAIVFIENAAIFKRESIAKYYRQPVIFFY